MRINRQLVAFVLLWACFTVLPVGFLHAWISAR